jgi:hypothetical protein
MSDSDDDIIDFLLCEKNVCLDLCAKKRVWVHEWYEDRSEGEYRKTCLPLQKDPIKFREYYRLKVETFDFILKNIYNDLHSISNFRECISPEDKLRCLARH